MAKVIDKPNQNPPPFYWVNGSNVSWIYKSSLSKQEQHSTTKGNSEYRERKLPYWVMFNVAILCWQNTISLDHGYFRFGKNVLDSTGIEDFGDQWPPRNLGRMST